MIISLYIKTHNITGLRYFGKTVVEIAKLCGTSRTLVYNAIKKHQQFPTSTSRKKRSNNAIQDLHS